VLDPRASRERVTTSAQCPALYFGFTLDRPAATDRTACPKAEPFKSHSSPARPSAFAAGSGSSTPCARARTARCTFRSRGEVTGKARLWSGPTTKCEGGSRPGPDGESDQRQLHQASRVAWNLTSARSKATHRAATRRCLRGGLVNYPVGRSRHRAGQDDAPDSWLRYSAHLIVILDPPNSRLEGGSERAIGYSRFRPHDSPHLYLAHYFWPASLDSPRLPLLFMGLPRHYTGRPCELCHWVRTGG